MEKVCPWCGQLSDRGWLKNRTGQIECVYHQTYQAMGFHRPPGVVTPTSSGTGLKINQELNDPNSHELKPGSHCRSLLNT